MDETKSTNQKEKGKKDAFISYMSKRALKENVNGKKKKLKTQKGPMGKR